MDKKKRTNLIRSKASELGFEFVGIAKAEKMDPESRRLEDWLNNHHHGTMSYMANHFELRTDPTKLVPGAKSVISLMYNYYTPEKQEDPEAPKLSIYAYGSDYHKVVKKKLKMLIQYIQENIGEVNGRAFVDSAPVLERDWARRSGLGWVGKNTMIIHPKRGSYFFLCELICDLELVFDDPIKDYCGTCTRCIDACPTDAISKSGYWMDGSKCISYLTIERKEAIPEEFSGKMDNWMFGCDICQQVCPWNRFSEHHQENQFNPNPEMLSMTKKEWQEITEDIFQKIFEGTPVKRTKFQGLKRNIDFLLD